MVDVLSKNVAILGQSEKMARAFCSNIDEYLLNPKYLQMYEAGREAMVLGMRNPGGDLGLVGTLDDWNKPASGGRSFEGIRRSVVYRYCRFNGDDAGARG